MQWDSLSALFASVLSCLIFRATHFMLIFIFGLDSIRVFTFFLFARSFISSEVSFLHVVFWYFSVALPQLIYSQMNNK